MAKPGVLQQLPLFVLGDYESETLRSHDARRASRSGTFVDNMKLPVHRWFRYSAGFSAQWVEDVLNRWGLTSSSVVLDPFAGSGTVLLAADTVGVRSIGIEAHPFVARIMRAKMLWDTPITAFVERAEATLQDALGVELGDGEYPDLIRRCFTAGALQQLDSLKRAWLRQRKADPASELVWLAVTAILRAASTAGTAQWQYILPNKTKRVTARPFEAFRAQIALMKSDMLAFREGAMHRGATVFQGDARECPPIPDDSVDAVITSPPYANNYDYADATRFEMSFWGELQGWGDLHDAVRKHLIVSSSQHASAEKLILDDILTDALLEPIGVDLRQVCEALAEERLQHGGQKHYHTMVAAYFADMARVWRELRRVCGRGAKVCFVIGDSAPYGVYLPVDAWLGQLAMAAGFRSYRFEKLRDRNIKWKNRKHRVPLQEGLLWVEG